MMIQACLAIVSATRKKPAGPWELRSFGMCLAPCFSLICSTAKPPVLFFSGFSNDLVGTPLKPSGRLAVSHGLWIGIVAAFSWSEQPVGIFSQVQKKPFFFLGKKKPNFLIFLFLPPACFAISDKLVLLVISGLWMCPGGESWTPPHPW